MVFVHLLDKLGVLFFFRPEDLVFLLLLNVILDLFLEHSIALGFLHLVHDLFDNISQLDLVQLDQLLIATNIWIVLKLTAQVVGLPFQSVRHSQNFILRVLEFILLTDTFQLTPPRDQVSILDFELSLHVHSLGDLLTICLAHLIAHVGLKPVQEGQLLDELNMIILIRNT